MGALKFVPGFFSQQMALRGKQTSTITIKNGGKWLRVPILPSG